MSDPVEVAEGLWERLWNRGDVGSVDGILAEEYMDHTLPQLEEGDIEGLIEDVQMLRAAMPDLHVEIEDWYRDDDFVILRTVFSGTQRGELFGIAPAGNRAEWDEIDVLRFEGDEIAERWAVSDTLAVMQQLGGIAVPESNDVSRTDLIERLAEIPRQFRATLRDQIIRTQHDGAASASAAMGHLWQTESDLWQTQLEEVGNKDEPAWDVPVEDPTDWSVAFDSVDLNLLLDAFEFRRSQTCAYLRGLSEEGWARRAKSEANEKLDVAGLIAIVLEHDNRHLAELSGTEL